METKHFTLSEIVLDPILADELIKHLVDSKINIYRMKSMQDWEKNHSSKSKWELQIDQLIVINKIRRPDFIFKLAKKMPSSF